MQTTLRGGCWNSGKMRLTSKESYKKLLASCEGETQINMMLKQYVLHPFGLTDAEMQIVLREENNLWLDKARIAGRRYDINKSFGQAIIINEDGEQRENNTGRKGLVWKVNKYDMGEC